MTARLRIGIGIVLGLLLAPAVPAAAGGWAVITLDALPYGVAAETPFTVGFMLRQHGRTLMIDQYPTVTASLPGAEPLIFKAVAKGQPGHYVASLTLPAAGDWAWSIQAFTMDQPMPTLQVAASDAGLAAAPVQTPALSMRVGGFRWAGALLTGLGALSILLAYQRPLRWARVVGGLCLAVGPGGMAFGVVQRPAQSVSAAAPALVAGSPEQRELGRRLFVAKGCITCHVDRKIENSAAYWTIEMGAPDLSSFSASPEILRLRLKDPAAVNSQAKMPNLELKEPEIEALIAFINSP